MTAFIVDWSEVATLLASAAPLPLAAAVALTVPLLALLAWRWAFIARKAGAPIPFVTAWKEYYLSTLLNQVLPGGVVGDVSRYLRIRSDDTERRSAVGRAIVIDRLSGQLVLWVATLVIVVVWSLRADANPSVQTVARATGVVLGLTTVVGITTVVALRSRRLRNTGPGRALSSFGNDAYRSLLAKDALPLQLGASVVALALLIAMFGLCGVAIGSPAEMALIAVVAPLILGITSIPITIGGWGAREAATAGLFGALAWSPTEGAAVGAAFGLVNLVGSLPGIAVGLRAQRFPT